MPRSRMKAGLVLELWLGITWVKSCLRPPGECEPFGPSKLVKARHFVALKLAISHEVRDIIVELDCQVLVNRLSKGAIFSSDLDTVLEDDLLLSKNFISIVWSHVLRDGNFVARHLGRLIPFGIEQRWENHYPSKVDLYVLMDTLSID